MPAPDACQTPREARSSVRLALLLGWALLWNLVQTVLERRGAGPGAQVLALALGHLALLGGLLLRARVRTLALLTAPSFAALQAFLLALAVMLGSLVLQGLGSPATYARAYAESPAPLRWTVLLLVRVAHGADLYHSLGFQALAALFCACALAVAWQRRPYRLPRVGFLLVHLAPAVILCGALLGRFAGERAYGELRKGQPTDRLQRLKDGSPVRLPFQLRLDAFRVEQGDPEYRLYAYVQPDGRGGFERSPKSYRPRQGLAGRLPLTDLRFEVERLLPNGVDRGHFVEDPAAPEDPAVAVLLGTGRPDPLQGPLFARRDPGWRRDEPEGRFAVAYRERFEPSELAQLSPRAPKAERLVLEMGGHRFEHPAEVGGTWETPGFRLKVLALYPDFTVQHGPDGAPRAATLSRTPREPWLELEITLRGEPSPRRLLLSARNPEVTDRLNAPHLPEGVGLRYVRVGEERQRRFVLLTRADRRARLVEEGRVLREEPLEVGRPFLVGQGLSVTVLAFLDHPAYVPDYEAPKDAALAVQERNPVLKVRLTDAAGRSESAWLAGAEAGSALFFGGRVGLVYRPKASEPRDFRSTLALLDGTGGLVGGGTTAVNAPFRHGGWWFFQSNYRPEDPDLSGITAVRDPGLPLVFLGLAMLLAGLPWMLLLKPWLKRRAQRLPEAP